MQWNEEVDGFVTNVYQMWALGWTLVGEFKRCHTGLHKVLDLQEELEGLPVTAEEDQDAGAEDSGIEKDKRRERRKA